MNIAVLTLFPEMFEAVTRFGVSARALAQELMRVKCFNPRDCAVDRHRTVDDRPYGGGPGMVMKADVLASTLAAARSWLVSVNPDSRPRVVYLSPQGGVLKQPTVVEWASGAEDLVLIAGRYEGVDERFIDEHVDIECSIGDYVLSGGELPAMVLIDALVRLQPGALGDSESALQDSFANGLLDCPHYTRPEQYRERSVPAVLLSGDHARIEQWRHQQALGRTAERRPELLAALELTERELEMLRQYRLEKGLADA